jgi:gluconate 5-dehydrogenase
VDPMTAQPGFDIEGRIAFVTGSSRGIGYALATSLAEARAVVILNGRDADALERSRDEIIDATGGVVHARAFDAASSQQVASAAKHIESEIGPVDFVVNNTGVQHRSPLLDFADAVDRRSCCCPLDPHILVVQGGDTERGQLVVVALEFRCGRAPFDVLVSLT